MNRKILKIGLDEWVCYAVIIAACLKLPNALQDIGNFAYAVSIAMSGLYLLWKLVLKRTMFKGTYNMWGIVLIGLFVISLFVNNSFFVMRNIRATICGTIFFFLLVQQGENCDRKSLEKRIHIFNMIIIISTLLYGITMLCFVFFKGQLYLTNFSGNTITIGWNVGRIMGIYAEGNLAGVASFISFAIGLVEIAFFKFEKNRIKWLIYTNQIVQFLCVALSSSRSACLALLVTVFVMVFIILKQREKRTWLLLLKAIGIDFVVGIILIVSSSLLYMIPTKVLRSVHFDMQNRSIEYIEGNYEEEENVSIGYRILTGKQAVASETENSDGMLHSQSVANNNEEIKNTEGLASEEVNGSETIESKLDESSSGRVHIWKNGLEKLKEHMLVGSGLYGTENQYVLYVDEQGIERIEMNYVSMHSDYVQAYVAGGILGGTAFITYILYVLFNVKKYASGILKFSNEDKIKVGSLFAFVCGMLFIGLLVCVFYFDVFNFGAIFWSYFGFLLFYTKILYDERK